MSTISQTETAIFDLEAHITNIFHFCICSDIDLYPKNTDVIVKVNGMEIPVINLPYQHPTGFHPSLKNYTLIASFHFQHGSNTLSLNYMEVKYLNWLEVNEHYHICPSSSNPDQANW